VTNQQRPGWLTAPPRAPVDSTPTHTQNARANHCRRSKRTNGEEEANSIHAADTVLAGEKWICTRWMKDAADAP
jgi:hypothetical protein